MKIIKRAAGVSLSLIVLSSVFAAPRLETPRPFPTEITVLTTQPPTTTTVAALGIGKPSKLAMLDSWVTSDMLATDTTTEFVWFDNETLGVVLSFYTTDSRDVRIILQVRDETGAIVVPFDEPVLVTPDQINSFLVPVGILPAGSQDTGRAYKVVVKVKQGARTVGQQYWIGVFTPPPGL